MCCPVSWIFWSTVSPAPLEIHITFSFLAGWKILCKAIELALTDCYYPVGVYWQWNTPASKKWHQICKWPVFELFGEMLSKLQINDFQREMAMYSLFALDKPPISNIPALSTGPILPSSSCHFWRLVEGTANSSSHIKIWATETRVGGQWEAERELEKGLAGSMSQGVSDIWNYHSLHSVLITKPPRQVPSTVLAVERSWAAGQ